jgi:LPS export ABC transporter protein LptC
MKFRTYIMIAVLGISAIATGWLYESRVRTAQQQAESEIPDNIDYFLTHLDYRAMAATGHPDFAFQSPRLEHHPATDISHIQIPSIQIFRDPDPWLVDALKGEYQHQANILRLMHQVVMRREGEEPIQIHAERMRFEPDIDLVTSESNIVMESEVSRIEAEHAVFNLANRVYSMRNARTTYHNDQS